MPAKIIAALFCLMCCISFAADSTILYKWTDANGNIKFGDRPPAGVKFERIKVRKDKRGDSSATAITEKLKDGSAANDENADVKEQIDKAQEQISQACKIAKANMETLKNSRLISISDGKGGKRLINDEEREERKSQTQAQIKRYCEQGDKKS